ncbi:replication initiator protein [robinz microvirus RP_175]|nr:replication initiator protein [robinz microvirus RP_175]
MIVKCTSNNPFPCGQCMACRINARRIWQSRLMLEAESHEHIFFSTLTLKQEGDGNVHKFEFSKFLKSLREEYRSLGILFRFFAVGEYGDQFGRPHYHAIFFGIPWQARLLIDHVWQRYDLGHQQETGTVRHDPFSRHLAAYITGYVSKKWTKPSPLLGGKNPEFMSCSRRPGLGVGYVPRLVHGFSTGIGPQALAALGDVPVSLCQSKASLPLGRLIRGHTRNALFGSPKQPLTGAYAKHLDKVRELETLMQTLPKDIPLSERKVETYKLYDAKIQKLKRISKVKAARRREMELTKGKL